MVNPFYALLWEYFLSKNLKEDSMYATIMYPKIPYHSSAIKWPTHILRFRTRVDTFLGLRLRCCKKLRSEKRDNKPVLCINQNDLKLMHSTINTAFMYPSNQYIGLHKCTKKNITFYYILALERL